MDHVKEVPRRLIAENIGAFLARDIPLREMLLDPVIPMQGLVMLHSWRGIGKTHTALGIAYAVASGGKFLKWTAPVARRVIYIDGEMPASTMQERLAAVVKASEGVPPQDDYFRLITPDSQSDGMPDLSTEEGQLSIEQWLADGCDLLVLDNLSTLVRSGKENEAEGWSPVQGWMLRLRSRGISVLLVHHSGKGGNQRGTSRREDVLDTVINLKRPGDYQPSEGARFEVHLEKARGVHGDPAVPFEAQMEVLNGITSWAIRDLEDSLTQQVMSLLADGLTQRDIAKELGIGLGTVNRHKKAASDGSSNPMKR